jgi:hypothetical protein
MMKQLGMSSPEAGDCQFSQNDGKPEQQNMLSWLINDSNYPLVMNSFPHF